MKLIFVLLLTAFVYTNSVPVYDADYEWESFKLKHGKQYTTNDEETLRLTIFKNNLEKISNHNELFEKGLVSYKMGVNKFTDLTPDEFKSRYAGYKKMTLRDGDPWDGMVEQYEPNENVKLPGALDWRKLGAVTGVKDQGTCGGCWSFSATGGLEGQFFKKTNTLISISEQNLLDCSKLEYYNGACDGGNMYGAFAYVINNKGIDSEESYPFEGTNGTCRYSAANSVTSATAIMAIESGNEDVLKYAVAALGPLSIGIDVDDNFSNYESGIFYSSTCSSVNLNHGALLVGYGSVNGEDYWLVKNSWSADWGEDGYIRVARNRDNHCGVATDASVPVL